MALARVLSEAEKVLRQADVEWNNQRMREEAEARWRGQRGMNSYQNGDNIYSSGRWGISNSNLGGNGLGNIQEAYQDFQAAIDRSALISNPVPVPPKPGVAMLEVSETSDADLNNGRVNLAMEAEDVLGYTPLRTEVKAQSRLQRALANLEIDIYKPETVSAYKEKMRIHFQVKADNADRQRIIDTKGFRRPQQTVVRWRLVELSQYKKPVPEHVLRKCVQIKKAVPEAIFHVDELVEETRTLDPFMVVSLGGESAVIEVWDEPQFEE